MPLLSRGGDRSSGTLNSIANTTFDIELFGESAGPGGTQTLYLDTVAVMTDGSGNAAFTRALQPVTPGHRITATATRRLTPSGGETSEFGASVTAPDVVDDRGPQVVAVYVKSSRWGAAFLDHLADTGRGDRVYGYAILAGSQQLNELPWTGLNQVTIRFTETVTVPPPTLLVRAAVGDAGNASARHYELASFSYSGNARAGTWTLRNSIRADRVLLDLDADSGLVDVAGNRLDGEWNNGADAFPSGDLAPGGDFHFRFNVLPGDADRSGTVLANDYSDVKRKFFSSTATPGTGPAAYSIFHDIDGSASILANDYSVVKSRFFDTLPDEEPAVSASTMQRTATLLVREPAAG